MINIIIELDSFGLGFKKILYDIVIINNLKSKDSPKKGNYDLKINGIKYKNIVQEFNREDGALKLLYKCLEEFFKNAGTE
jgi:hypothetical protein